MHSNLTNATFSLPILLLEITYSLLHVAEHVARGNGEESVKKFSRMFYLHSLIPNALVNNEDA